MAPAGMVMVVMDGMVGIGGCAVELLGESSWLVLFFFLLDLLASADAAAGPLEAASRAEVVDFGTVSLEVGSVDMLVHQENYI
jgi:uncharacterized membrane protein